MRILNCSVLCLSLLLLSQVPSSLQTDDNEFAEFEDEEVELAVESSTTLPKTESPEVPSKPKVAEDDFDDDYGVVDEEEQQQKDEELVSEPLEEQKIEPLKFADVPAHFRSNWASYQVEAIVLAVIALYLLNYVIGRSSNNSIVNDWFKRVQPALQKEFALVGDNGSGESLEGGKVVHETDYSYTIWCTGRVGLSTLWIQIRTVKRQDLVSRIMGFFSPQNDRAIFRFELDAGEIDSFVLAVGQKKPTTKVAKEMLDLSTFAPEKKNVGQFSLPVNYSLFNEQPEVAFSLFDSAVATVIRRYEKAIEYIHISDKYSGPKPPEGETYTRMPESVNLVQFSINLNECNTPEGEAELLQLMFYLVDKVRKIKLTKEAKGKADKRRREFEDEFLKTTHQIRQEAAQARREEKTRERKQRLLEEEDPDKQRRLEKLELKREAKAKQPKMKQLRMKM